MTPTVPAAPRRTPAALAAALVAMLVVAGPARAQDPLDQTIDADQATATGPATLADGHVDIGPRFHEGAWTLMVHDDAEIPAVWRTLADTVIAVTDTAVQTVPDDPTYDFLGVDPGTPVHVIPQVQQSGVVWVGWNTQDPEVLDRIDQGATLTLLGVQGPGELIMYLQAGNLTEPDVLWRSTETDRQPLFIEVNTHTHANWVFTEPGTYLAEVEIAATLVGGEEVVDTETLRFAVGDQADADEARAATFTQPTAPPDVEASPAREADDEESTSGGGTAGLLVLAVAAVLVLAVVAVVLRSSRAKRRARVEATREVGR